MIITATKMAAATFSYPGWAEERVLDSSELFILVTGIGPESLGTRVKAMLLGNT